MNWRAVVGYEESYEVSDQGLVRSIQREARVPCRWGGTMLKRNEARVLKPWLVGAGYRMVALGLARRHRKYVHRLVAEAFLGSPLFKDPEVNHLDGDKTNNKALNLQWVTTSENMCHATYVLGKRRGQFGPGRVRVA